MGAEPHAIELALRVSILSAQKNKLLLKNVKILPPSKNRIIGRTQWVFYLNQSIFNIFIFCNLI